MDWTSTFGPPRTGWARRTARWIPLAALVGTAAAITDSANPAGGVSASPPVASGVEEPRDSLQVEVIESDIDVKITSDGYHPAGDVLVGTHGDEAHPSMYLISPDGGVQEAWRIANRPGEILLDRRILPNGNVLFLLLGDGAFEMTREGEIVWAHPSDDLTHHAEFLENGNILLAGALCDCVREVDRETQEVVWEWEAEDAFPDYDNEEAYRGGSEYGIASLYTSTFREEREWPETWAHVNYAQVLDNGNVVVSLRNFDLVAEVDRDGRVVWSFGPGIIKHQHTPVDLGDGTLVIFDNGNHRAIHVDRGTGEILWSYDDLDSPIMGDVGPLTDGNYKVVDSVRNTVKVVSPEGEVKWRMDVDPPGEISGIYRAHLPELEP